MNTQKRERIAKQLRMLEAAISSHDAAQAAYEVVLQTTDPDYDRSDFIRKSKEAEAAFDLLAKDMVRILLPIAKAGIEIVDYIGYAAAGSVGLKQSRLRVFLHELSKLDSDKSISHG